VAYAEWDAGPLEAALGLEVGSLAQVGDGIGPLEPALSRLLQSV
jgi:hypothetical protein